MGGVAALAKGVNMGQDSPAGMFAEPIRDEANPIDVVEAVLGERRSAYDRGADCELTLFWGGKWTDHHVGFSYLPGSQALQVTLMFDPRVPDGRKTEVLRLLALMNAQNWLGHFDFWDEDRTILFRFGMPLRGAPLGAAQCEDVIDLTLEACETFFPALQYVLWAGMSAQDAAQVCLFETRGEA